MIVRKIANDTYYLGANDTQTDLFESLWPLPEGVTYNAYLIIDEKTALIDTVEEKFEQDFIAEIKKILNRKKLDYLIINHMEPDHSGAILQLKKEYPDLTIVGNKKTASFVHGFYHLPQTTVQVVKSGDSLNLGKHELNFIQTPMVHWPESMVAYDSFTKTLFSSDIFGGFKTTKEKIFDQDYSETELVQFEQEARRYFANIIGAYTRPAKRALKQVNDYKINIIAPAHGLVWKKNPKKVINWYQDWANLKAEAGVVIVYGSMYGHTKKIAEALAVKLTEAGISQVELLDAARLHTSFLISAVWKHWGLVIASSTYTNDVFPPIKTFLSALEERKVEKRYLGLFGSYSWTGGALKGLQRFAQNSKMELIEPSFRADYGDLNQEVEEQANQLAQNFAKKINSN